MKKKKKRINEWEIAFWVIVVTLIFYIGLDSYKFNTFKCDEINICGFITGTPSWIYNNTLLGSGYKENISVDYLMSNNITFVYREGCGWCDRQIKGFGVDWEKYKESGLVLECGG